MPVPNADKWSRSVLLGPVALSIAELAIQSFALVCSDNLSFERWLHMVEMSGENVALFSRKTLTVDAMHNYVVYHSCDRRG